jgi:glyoxylase-like metal-dependent hydrolase (beta-lactamase superfamily II)
MRVRRVVADNPSAYTGPGTNTWILEGDPVAVVIDPGPDDDRHLAAIEESLAGAAVGVVLVTHSHSDHLPLAGRLAERHRARVLRYPDLDDKEEVKVGKVRLRALYTPGHASDHLCFLQEEDGAVFTGDLVLGKGSTMITYPDGDMADYFHSLDRLLELRPTILFPGHWDPITDPMPKLQEYKRHRLERERQVLRALAEGPGDSAELTRRVYAKEVSGEQLFRAAEMTLQAHLRKLVDEGRVRSEGSLFSLP